MFLGRNAFVVLGAAGVLASACGAGGHAKPRARRDARAPLTSATVCRTSSHQVVARTLAVAPGAVAAAGSLGNNLMPQCTFTAAVADSRVRLIANVDNGPSPYYLLERTAEEQAQVFAPTPLVQPPQDITGLGLDADWFPAEQQLMTTDGRLLITITVSWPRASTSRKIAVASALARTYLGPNDNAAVNLYP